MTGSTRTANRRGGRTLRALAFLTAILINLMLLAGLALYLMDDDDYRRALIWSTDYFLDSRLEIDGPFSIRFAQEVELNAEKVRLQANDGSYQVALGKLYLQQRFTSYLRTGTFWINKLNVDDLQVEITATQSDEEFDWQQLSVVPVVVEETRIGNLSLSYSKGEQRHALELRDILIDDENDQGPIKVGATGTVDSRPVVFAGTLGSMAQLRSDNQSFPVTFTLRSDGSADKQDKPVIVLEGTVDRKGPGDSTVDATFDVDLPGLAPYVSPKIIAQRLGHLQGSLQLANVHHDWSIRSLRFNATDTDLYRLKIDAALDKSEKLVMRSEFEVPDPAAFGAQLGIDLGGYGAYSGKGELSGNLDRLHYRGRVSVGRIESDLDASVTLHGSRPSIQGKWVARKLYLADIGITTELSEIIDPTVKAGPVTSIDSQAAKPETAAAAVDADGKTPDPMHETFDLSALRKLDLDLGVSIDAIVGEDYAVEHLAGKVRLTNGLLRLTPMRMTYQGGTTDLELTLAARKTPEFSVRIEAQDQLLDELLGRLRPELRATGKLDLQANLKSAGSSLDEMLSAVSGDISLKAEKVDLPRQYLQYFSVVGPPSRAAGNAYTSVEIDGAASARIGKELQLTARSVRLETDDGSYRVTLDKLNLRQSLAAYREKDTLLIHDLLLEDARVEVVVAETAEATENEAANTSGEQWNEADWQGYGLPSLAVEKMQLARLSLDYREGDKQRQASLRHFSIANDDAGKPMTVSAAGTVDALALQLEGSVGTPAQPRGEKRSYPIDFSLSSGNLDSAAGKPVIRFSGTVDDGATGGKQLNANFNVVLAELMKILNPGTDASLLGQLQGEINIVEVDDRWGIKKLQLAAIDTDLYQFHVDGEVDESRTLALNTETIIPDPAAFGAQLGIDLVGYKSYHGKGLLSGTRNKLDYLGVDRIGRIQSETSLTVTRVKGKPFISGKFTIANLYLPDIGLNFRMIEEPQEPQKSSADKSEPPQAQQKAVPANRQLEPIFSHEPFDFSGLQNFNLDLEVLIDEITGTDFAIDKLTGEIGLTDGVLRVSPMRLIVESGETRLDLVIDSRERPSATLKLKAERLLLGDLISQLQTEAPVQGAAHLKVDVKTSGDSAHEMASELSGDVGFGLEDARFPRSYLDFLSANVFGWMYGMVTFEHSYTPVDCLIMDFDVDQGVAKSNLLVADGPNVIIEGKASIDLGLETIDMALVPKEKRSFHTSIASAEIKGPLRNPEVHTSTGRAAALGISGLVLIPEVFVPLALADILWKQLVHSNERGGGCSEFLAKYREKQQKAAGQSTE